MSNRYPWLRAGALMGLLALGIPAQQDFELGKMWTFERAPLDYWEREYGFRPDQEWLNKVRLASLRFGSGCSASFVSPSGLIMTNHHCVRDDIARAQGSNDWVKDGYVATAAADEVPIPELVVRQMVRNTDVTERMNRGLDDATDPEQIARLRTDNEAAILDEARAEDPDLEPEVVKLFQGAVWQLYQYRVFDDIRLVVAPHLQAAHFGGDADNFTYPRFGIDFAFCRAYVDDKPADTSETYFEWSNGAAPEELVFLTGNPGGTERLLTRAQLEYLRDAYLPRRREMIDNRLVIMRSLAAQNENIEKALRNNILSYENAQKAWRGEHTALLDESFLARKDVAEAAFKARIHDNDELRDQYGDLWSKLAEVSRAKLELDFANEFQTHGGHPLLAKAVAIIGAADGDADDEERQQILEMEISGNVLVESFFVDHLVRAQGRLPEGDPYLQAVLGGRDPQAAYEHLKTSRLGEREFVEQLLDGGADALAASDDPAIAAGRVIHRLMDKNATAWEKLEAREEELGARMGRALFAAYGDEVSPDATFTLRISDGRVRGYAYNGTLAPPRTAFYGMFSRNAEFDKQYPFNLPDIWLQRQGRLDLAAAVNFVCTVDSTGGNSGSPVVNKDREIVGLLFDGNIESLSNQYIYGEESGERSVCVHPQAIMEALTKVYDAQRIADELLGR